MRCSFEPATRERHLVLCDPAALPSPTRLDPAPGPALRASAAAAAISRLAEEGRALVVQVPEGDCHATFHVLVDEEPAASLRDRGSEREGVRGAVLHLPSGTLTAGGVELLEPGSAAQAHARAAVPPGVYQLDAVHVGSREDGALLSAPPPAAPWPARVARSLARLAPGALGAGLVAAALSATVATARGSWIDGATAAAIVLAVVGALLAFTSLLGAVARLYPGRPPSPEVIAALERENPHIVVVLRAIREAPPRFPPARLRIGV